MSKVKSKKVQATVPSFSIRTIAPDGAKVTMFVYEAGTPKAALREAKKRTGKALRRVGLTQAVRRKSDFDIRPLIVTKVTEKPEPHQYITLSE